MNRKLTLTTALISMISIPAFAGSTQDSAEDIVNMEKYKDNAEAVQYEQHEKKHKSKHVSEAMQDESYHHDKSDKKHSEYQAGSESMGQSSDHTRVMDEASSEAEKYSTPTVDADEYSEERLHTFNDYDINNNGEIDKNEIFTVDSDQERFGEVEFDELDANDDEVVSIEEWQNYFKSSAAVQ